MQSTFTVRNMDSTPEPPSPNMAAAAPAKRKFRKCTHCPSRMPSFAFDNHTLCTKCRNQVCDMVLVCDECRDWPPQKRRVFVNYNNSLRTRREYKRRQARLAGAASDQSVGDTDTDVPLDEPSVPVQNVHFDTLGQQQCLVSEEVVVSAAPSTEVAQSDVLVLPAVDSLDKLAASIFSRLSELHSSRGPPAPVQSHSVGSEFGQPGVILPNVCQPSFADSDFVGAAAPPQLFHNPVQPLFRLSTAPVSGETPHRPVASVRRIQELQEELASTRQAISTLCDNGVRPPQSLLDSASSLSRDLENARQSSSRPGVSSSAKPTSTQSGPSRPEFDPAVPGPSRRRSLDSPQHYLGHSSRQGSDTPPRKRRRLSGDSSEDEDSSSQTRRHRDDLQDEEDNFRPASLDLPLKYITKKFPAASQPLVQPSSKRFHVMETAGLVDESSQQSSNLAWFGHLRSACDSAQRKFEAKVSEGKSLSSILTSVSRTERVSDSPCQGRAVRVNSQVFDLMGSKPSESRSIPLSVREAATLETALRGVMESYNFQLWTVTALFRFLSDSGCCPMDDPLLDQFQRSFSRGAENVAAALASTTAFVTAKRRESFLTHMVPSVTDAQKHKLLSDHLFDQRDLFAPASIEAAREAARDVSLYRGAQSRPSTSSGSNQRRQFHSSSSIIFFGALPTEEEIVRSP